MTDRIAMVIAAQLLALGFAAYAAVAAPPPAPVETSPPPAADVDQSSGARLSAPPAQYDLSVLPKPVARLRDQLLDAARSGDIDRLRAIIEGNDGVPTFSFGGEEDPIAFWKEVSGDGQGREILAILMEVLEAGFVHVKRGDNEELYIWPYFAETPISGLTPTQEVELYKLVTAQDRKDMEEFGAYHFYRVGIKPDGQWLFFVAGD